MLEWVTWVGGGVTSWKAATSDTPHSYAGDVWHCVTIRSSAGLFSCLGIIFGPTGEGKTLCRRTDV